MIGNGEPTIGNNPKTMHMFTETNIKIAEAKPKQKSLPKKLLDKNPILTILNIITA